MTNETTPLLIMHASSVPYLSIARHTCGVRYNGSTYLYHPERDILIRNDWVKFYNKMPFDQFMEAVKTGITPTLPQKEKKEKPIVPIKTLFD